MFKMIQCLTNLVIQKDESIESIGLDKERQYKKLVILEDIRGC